MCGVQEYTTNHDNKPPEPKSKETLASFELKWDERPKDTPMGHAPPYLLEFDGSVWMRHEENKKIAQDVGLESYIHACSETDVNSEDQRMAVTQDTMLHVLHGIFA